MSGDGVYKGPGLWEGCVVVPAVIVVAAINAIVVALTDAPVTGLRVGFAGSLTGVVFWIALWEAFSRMHPRFATGRGEQLKYFLVMGAPPLLAFVAAVLAR